MKMPFGKFKGIEIKDIDKDYLLWLIENSNNLSYNLKKEIVDNLKNTSVDLSDLQKIRRVYLELAKKYHPDKGGSNQTMQAINEFYSILKNL